MIHAFMLVVVLGTGDERKVQPNAMIFRSIDVCLYYAKRIPRQYGNFRYKDYVDPRIGLLRIANLSMFRMGQMSTTINRMLV